MAPRRPRLRELAADVGIVDSYRATDGAWVETSDDARVALLAAMGIAADTEARAHAAAEQRRRERSWLTPARVDRIGAVRNREIPLPPAGKPGARLEWEVAIDDESGGRRSFAGVVVAGSGRRTLRVPACEEHGLYRVEVRWQTARAAGSGQQLWIVAPRLAVSPQEKLGDARHFGICANLYSVRDGRSAIGDLTTLTRLCRWAAGQGAAFVGVNPLNAIRARGDEVSPYSPTSRLYRSELYLDLDAVPEMEQSAAARALAATSDVHAAMLDYATIGTHKLAVLRHLHACFRRRHQSQATGRGEAYRAFVARGGEELHGFALFRALDDHFETAQRGTHGWRSWPAAYRDPAGPAVRRFAAEHADAIDFHCYVQFELDRQLAACARSASRAGLGLGLVQDLPIGAVPSGCEDWLHRDLFCRDASVGAPPDSFFAGGQNWGLSPIDPTASLDRRLAYWQRLLRAAFAHAGALRVDHVMGLVRQFWIPKGMSPSHGAYVRMPAEELFAVLALESSRAGAVVIGEDLGTVPDEVPRLMRRWGILSTKVLYFECGEAGSYRAPSAYPSGCLLTANTHDLATLAGFECGRDLELHHAAGVLDDEQRAEQVLDRRAAVAVLRRQTRAPGGRSLMAAVYEFLASSRARLLGVALDDLAGEIDPVNLPGVPIRRYPSWQRRMGRTLREIARRPEVQATLTALRRVRPGPQGPTTTRAPQEPGPCGRSTP